MIEPYAIPAHLTPLLTLLQRCPTASDRKGFIIAAHCHGIIDMDETGLLIQALMLETA